jgi:hypothetical protein
VAEHIAENADMEMDDTEEVDVHNDWDRMVNKDMNEVGIYEMEYLIKIDKNKDSAFFFVVFCN